MEHDKYHNTLSVDGHVLEVIALCSEYSSAQFPCRFGFHNASAIEGLIDKEASLATILDQDDLLQECKAQNSRLAEYFGRVGVLHRLFAYVTGEIEIEGKDRFKCAAAACWHHDTYHASAGTPTWPPRFSAATSGPSPPPV